MNPYLYSETGELETVVLAKPKGTLLPKEYLDYFGYLDVMDTEKAKKEIDELAAILTKEQVEVMFLDDYYNSNEEELANNLPNLIYTRDLAGTLGNKIFIGNNIYSSRFPEFVIFDRIINQLSNKEHIVSIEQKNAEIKAEFGDFLCISNEIVLINIGHRTTYSYIKKVSKEIFSQKFKKIALIQLPKSIQFAHLDLACNVLPDNKHLLINPLLKYLFIYEITIDDERIYPFPLWIKDNQFEIIEIPKQLYNNIGINYFYINPEHVVISNDDDFLKNLFKKFKTKVSILPLDAISKGGGGFRCITLPLNRKN